MLIFGVFSSPPPGVPGFSGSEGSVDSDGSVGSVVLEEDSEVVDSSVESSLVVLEVGSVFSVELSTVEGCSELEVSSEEEGSEVSPSSPSPGVPGTSSVEVVVSGVVVSEGFSDFTV